MNLNEGEACAMNRAIVIGATSGMGRELVKLLARDGWRVAACGRRTELLAELKSHTPGNVITRAFDITRTSSVGRRMEEMARALGGLDLVVISSGTGDENESLDYETEKRAIDTNVAGFTCAAGWAFNYFAKQGGGHLAAISSIAGLRGSRHAPAYNAGKAYQISYLEALRQKAGKHKAPVTVTDIRPGFVDTAMAKGEGLFWVAPVEKAARQIYRAIRKKKPVAYVTRRWALGALLIRLIPRALYERM